MKCIIPQKFANAKCGDLMWYSWKLSWLGLRVVILHSFWVQKSQNVFFVEFLCVTQSRAETLFLPWNDLTEAICSKNGLWPVMGQQVVKWGKISHSPHKSITPNAPNCKFSFLEWDKRARICYNFGVIWNISIVFVQIQEETGQLELFCFRNEFNS